jgi:hypothetical protein
MRWRKMMETRREERISNNSSKSVRAREILEWREENEMAAAAVKRD